MRTHLQSATLNDVYVLPAASSSEEFGSTASGLGGQFQINSDGYKLGGLIVPSPPQMTSPGTFGVYVFGGQPNGGMGSYTPNPYFQYEVMIHNVSPLFASFSELYGNIDVWVPLTQALRIDGYYYPGGGTGQFDYSLREGVTGSVVCTKTLWIGP